MFAIILNVLKNMKKVKKQFVLLYMISLVNMLQEFARMN